MKNTKNIVGLTLGALLIANAFAQAPVAPAPVVNNTQVVPGLSTTNIQPNTVANSSNVVPGQVLSTNVSDIGPASLATTNVAPPKPGNTLEKETTPLLREMSRKKAVLEIKKLDSEISKVEADALKAQQAVATPVSGRIINVQDPSNPPLNINPTMPTNIPAATSTKGLPTGNASQLAPVSNIQVLMTYGFDNNLYAKIASGSQGGYVVKKGDILPDGKEVVSVQPNYIEVRTPRSKSTKYQKIYVTGPVTTTTAGMPAPVASSSSANISPILGPLATPQMVQSGNVLTLPANPNNMNTGATSTPVGNPIAIPVR